jgi:anti-sigma factor RsiW
MTARRDSMDEAMLHAYVDGELDDRGRLEVEEWLNGHPDDSVRVAEWIAQRQKLHELFDPVLTEPIPKSITKATARRRSGRLTRQLAALAAAIALFVAGAVCGWLLGSVQLGGRAPGRVIAERALNAHLIYTSEVRHPVEVEAAQKAHLVAWLSKRLNTPIKAPDLTQEGFKLMGGRLLPDDSIPAAQFMYQNDAGQRITIYVVANNPSRETAFQIYNKGPMKSFFWLGSACTYAVTGAIDQQALLNIAHLIFKQLSSGAHS